MTSQPWPRGGDREYLGLANFAMIDRELLEDEDCR